MSIQQSRDSDGSAVRDMIRTLELCAAMPPSDVSAPLLGLAARVLTQVQAHGRRATADAAAWQVKYEAERRRGDLLRENVRGLAHEIDALRREAASVRTAATTPSAEEATAACASSTTSDAVEESLEAPSEESPAERCDASLVPEEECRPESGEDAGVPRPEGCPPSSSSPPDGASDVARATARERAPLSHRRPMESSSAKRTPRRAPSGLSGASPLSPTTLHLLERMSPPWRREGEAVPALTRAGSGVSLSVASPVRTSSQGSGVSLSGRSRGSAVSLSGASSVRAGSSAELLSATPRRRAMRMSPQPNAQWALIE